MKNERRISRFPDGFFTKERKVITTKESLKDIIPVEWIKRKSQTKKNTDLIKSKKLSLN